MSIEFALTSGNEIQVILWLVVANIVLGLLVSLLKGTFNFHHLSNFLALMVIPYLFGFAVLRVAATSLSSGDLIVKVAFVFVILTLLAGLWEKLGHFGLPSPKWLVRGEK